MRKNILHILTIGTLLLLTGCNDTGKDTEAPVITLNGDSNMVLPIGDNYIEKGATAVDNVDGIVPIVIEGNVDTSTVGNYTISYESQDTVGNISNVNRYIEVIELTDIEKIKRLEDNGTIPKLNRDDTLVGEDNNSNGVRDDIDIYIDEHYSKPKEHAAVIQSAKVLQKALLVDKSNMDEIRKVDIEDNRAVHCLFQVFEPAKISNEIESLTTNTKERLLEYLKYNKALDGTVSSEIEGDTCE